VAWERNVKVVQEKRTLNTVRKKFVYRKKKAIQTPERKMQKRNTVA
jgi:hypothetical protein